MKFDECPNCGSKEQDAAVLKCSKCGGYCCEEVGLLMRSGGCVGDGGTCPHCGIVFEVPLFRKSNVKVVGKISGSTDEGDAGGEEEADDGDENEEEDEDGEEDEGEDDEDDEDDKTEDDKTDDDETDDNETEDDDD